MVDIWQREVVKNVTSLIGPTKLMLRLTELTINTPGIFLQSPLALACSPLGTILTYFILLSYMYYIYFEK